jgi:CBS domain containing-hemolysin-like protein
MSSPGAKLLLSAVLVLANAFFVASEFAIVKIRPTRLQELVNQGGRRARMLAGVLDRLDAYLSANQLGVTLASLGLGWLGESAVADVVEPHLTGLGAWAGVASHSLALAVGLAAMTFLHVTVGELVPKSFALQLAEPVALWAVVPLRIFHVVAFPIVWVLKTSSNLMLRLMGLRPASEAEMLHSADELRLVLQHVKLEPGARRLIDRVFDYTHRVARHVMTLRRDVVVLVAGRPFEDNLKTALANQYTRYPLVEPGTDRVVGYVHLKDIVAALASGRLPKRMKEIAREPIYCSEETRCEWLRREFQRRRVHIAVVLGPSNSFVGIVTLEDLIEEFVGEIQDEQDVGEIPPVVWASDGRFEVDGRVTLDVAARDLGLRVTPPRPDIDTLAGFVQEQVGRPPQPGDVVEVPGFRLTAIEIRDGRIRRLRGEPVEESVEEETASPDETGQ